MCVPTCGCRGFSFREGKNDRLASSLLHVFSVERRTEVVDFDSGLENITNRLLVCRSVQYILSQWPS